VEECHADHSNGLITETPMSSRDALGIDDAAELRNVIGAPNPGSVNKEMPCLDELCRRFIALSPILFVSTVGADGQADVSPRGDMPGFVRILDDRTIAIPDRPGNRRIDTMSNILANPGGSVGLIFLVPGVDEVMRTSGRATISKEPELLATMAVDGKQPKLAIVISLDEVFFHCGKALKRAGLWDPERQVDRAAFPSYAQVIHKRRPHEPLEKIEKFIADNYRDELY
jgi:PPOX class probable FMN-dependent enzyme